MQINKTLTTLMLHIVVLFINNYVLFCFNSIFCEAPWNTSLFE